LLSTRITPGTIGLPGKWPAWYHSLPVNVCSPTARTPGSSSTTRSIKRNGSRCGIRASIAARSNVATHLQNTDHGTTLRLARYREKHENSHAVERTGRLGHRRHRYSRRRDRAGCLGPASWGGRPAPGESAGRTDGGAVSDARERGPDQLLRNIRAERQRSDPNLRPGGFVATRSIRHSGPKDSGPSAARIHQTRAEVERGTARHGRSLFLFLSHELDYLTVSVCTTCVVPGVTFDVMFATVVYVPALLPEAWYCTA